MKRAAVSGRSRMRTAHRGTRLVLDRPGAVDHGANEATAMRTGSVQRRARASRPDRSHAPDARLLSRCLTRFLIAHEIKCLAGVCNVNNYPPAPFREAW